MKIGLLYAMPVEIRGLLKNADAEPMEVISGVPFYQVSENIIAACGGVGKVNIAMAAELLCFHFKVDLVINAGLAGGCADLPIGTIVLGSDCVQHDMDTSAIGDPVGLVSTVDRIEFPTADLATAQKVLTELDIPFVTGRIATGDWFATRSARSEEMVERFAPTVCEMEACAIAQVCLRNNVKFMAIKSVSDRLTSEKQADEFFDYGEAIRKLDGIMLHFTEKLMEVMA